MRIIFIGVVDFSLYCLNEVLKNGGEVVGLLTTRSSKFNSDYCDLTPFAENNGIPVFFFKNVNDTEVIEWVKEKKPDVIFCWGVSQLIKGELLSMPPLGVVGAHPALLPENRGRHPLIWALALGLKKTGLTFFFMDEGADSGPILSQEGIDIDDDDSALSLYRKVEESAAGQIKKFLPMLKSECYPRVMQNESSANYWRKRSKADGIIDWRMGVRAILNLVRALYRPYSGAEMRYKGKEIIVWKAREYKGLIGLNIEPGKIFTVEADNPVIKCYDGAVVIYECEPQIEFCIGEYAE